MGLAELLKNEINVGPFPPEENAGKKFSGTELLINSGDNFGIVNI